MLRLTFRIIFVISALSAPAGTACVAQTQNTDIHTFIDDWHKAAAAAHADLFFDSMADDCIYIGTDKTERWTKEQFRAFAKPYFDRGKAWDFKPYARDLHVTSDGKSAWFSELLTTWMGVCRGSGMLTKEKGKWQLKQYHLSVTIPNDLIRDFITLVENFEKKDKP
jgi:ketosteroid isomerase-like protein